MIMEPSHYLDSEVLKHSNYPEGNVLAADLARLDEFFRTLNSAIAAYTEGEYEKVYLDDNEVTIHINLCQSVLETLGTAENPCFDILINIRQMLAVMYEIKYMMKRFGSMYFDSLDQIGGGRFGD